MNAAMMYRRLKRDIGTYGIALPFEDGYTLDQLMLDVIEDTTLPVFSIYYPRYDVEKCLTKEFKQNVDEVMGEACDLWIMPDRLFEGREVLYVREIEYANNMNERYTRYPGTMSDFGMLGHGVSSLETIMLANAQKPIMDELVNRVTFHYEYPRKLYIYDTILGTKLKIKLACQHDTSLQSIPPTAGESFIKLAMLDVQAALYNIVKPYLEMGGAYDRLAMKVEEWESAKSNRLELLKEWDDSFALDQSGLDFG